MALEHLLVGLSDLSGDYLVRRYIMDRLYRFDDIDKNLKVAKFRPLDVLGSGDHAYRIYGIE